MDRTIPYGATILLAFIRKTEVGREDRASYDVIFANKQGKLPVPLTSMTYGDIIDAQRAWSKNHGSSAAGAYQFMRATLIDLAKANPWISGSDPFTPELQDQLGYQLLLRRGYAPAARTIVRLMTIDRNNLTKAQTMTVAAIEERLPDLVEARDVVESFHGMLRRKSSGDLGAWIERAAKSLVASFANGVIRDRAAIQKAITSQWSNGQTEGQITKLKLIKRQMYGKRSADGVRLEVPWHKRLDIGYRPALNNAGQGLR
ncbi:transposase [Shinella sp. YE25]|uniref:transposase n=1 Tax=unclassified Shinella TaxID=2643062 RepID=UPI00225CCEB9|nr:transposase [Shinella sp. YE25]CAI0341689.1 hypothetical protein SHINE37_80079 [Rhizobiaceae bacterium]